MILFLSIILASLAVHLLNGWMAPFLGISVRAMIDLVVFIAVFMLTSRYLKSLKH